jgi:hypothetical protein
VPRTDDSSNCSFDADRAASVGATATDDDIFDVAIIGCGPVGALLAILLGRLNHRVVVLERHMAPYPLPRAVHSDDEIARAFAGAGVPAVACSEQARCYEWVGALQTLDARLVWIVPAKNANDDEPHPGITVVEDVDDRYLPYLAEHGLEAILVRPDFHLFGAAPTLAAVPALVDDLLEQLHLNVDDPVAGTGDEGPSYLIGEEHCDA